MICQKYMFMLMRICCLKLPNDFFRMNEEEQFSSFFYVLRGIAILSVAYAHSLSLDNLILQRISSLIGIIGVPVFLISSGFFFNPSGFICMMKKTIKGIAIPWLIWGTLAYLISVYLGSSAFSFHSGLSYILGNGTWLYFVPVLIHLRCFFYFIESDIYLLLAIAVSLATAIVSYYPPQQYIHYEIITPFQNPLNWCGYFALGILLKRHHLLNLFYRAHVTWIIVCMLSWIVVVWLLVDGSDKINYWHPLAVLFIYLSIPLLLLMATTIRKSRLLYTLGKNSYLLYFLHMQMGIATANIIFSKFIHWQLLVFILKPISVLGITYLLILQLKFFLNIFGWTFITKYIGIVMPSVKRDN